MHPQFPQGESGQVQLDPEIYCSSRCSRCPRADRLSVTRLIERYGQDAGLPTADLIGDCPQRHAGLYARCDIY
jgi:hypothetical protein